MCTDVKYPSMGSFVRKDRHDLGNGETQAWLLGLVLRISLLIPGGVGHHHLGAVIGVDAPASTASCDQPSLGFAACLPRRRGEEFFRQPFSGLAVGASPPGAR
jgi:hypothetical protein